MTSEQLFEPNINTASTLLDALDLPLVVKSFIRANPQRFEGLTSTSVGEVQRWYRSVTAPSNPNVYRREGGQR
jgi:hypothetical protein